MRERNNFYLVELFLRRLLSPKHHCCNPKTEPGKSKRSYKKLSSLNQVCGLEHCLDYLLYCTTVGSERSVNRGWYVAAGRIQGFMWLPALHCTTLHCSPLSCSVLLICAWLNSAPFSRRHGLLSALAIYYRILSSSGSVRYSSGQSSWLVLPFLASSILPPEWG